MLMLTDAERDLFVAWLDEAVDIKFMLLEQLKKARAAQVLIQGLRAEIVSLIVVSDILKPKLVMDIPTAEVGSG